MWYLIETVYFKCRKNLMFSYGWEFKRMTDYGIPNIPSSKTDFSEFSAKIEKYSENIYYFRSISLHSSNNSDMLSWELILLKYFLHILISSRHIKGSRKYWKPLLTVKRYNVVHFFDRILFNMYVLFLKTQS